MKRTVSKGILLLAGLAITMTGHGQSKKEAEAIPVGKVWAGHPVGFVLHTTDQYQYSCYYDSDRNMVIAQRRLDAPEWKKTVLPSVTGWDSHNYITMALDEAGYIHVSGNMHGVPLIYFRSMAPENIDQFEKLPMTGKQEEKVTYPVFFKNQQGNLFFQYRDGGSGQGITYWNQYDVNARQWKRAFDTPVFDGENEVNAYMQNPVLGPDGYFYIIWMWRSTYIANTNHNLSCIRSKDFTNWETIGGKKVTLPARWRDTQSVVDPVGPWNGLINMGFQINWDHQGRACITYHKYDGRGISQVFISRWEKDSWKTYQVSNWPDHKWDLDKGGSLGNDVSISGIRKADGKQRLTVDVHHVHHGDETWVLDEKTLQVVSRSEVKKKEYARTLPVWKLQEGMGQRQKADNTGKYILQWETLPVHQDRPRELNAPVYSDLVVYKVAE